MKTDVPIVADDSGRTGRVDEPSFAFAFGLFTLPLLRSLELNWVSITDSFLTGMVSAASKSQVRISITLMSFTLYGVINAIEATTKIG